MDFFEKTELDHIEKWANTAYEKYNPEHIAAGIELKDTIWSKTIFWANEVKKSLGERTWAIEGTRTWSQRGWAVIDNRNQRAAIFKGYTWARIFKKADKNHDIFFTIGYDAEGFFRIKLDFQRTRDSKLSKGQKELCDDFLKSNSIPEIKIPREELDDFNWSRLTFEAVDFIQKNEESYNLLNKLAWGKETGDEILTDTFDLRYAKEIIDRCLINKESTLDLGNCGLTDLSLIPALFRCIHIEVLILSNEWGEYVDHKWIRQKSKNDLKPNNLSYIPSQINNLVNLRKLVCGGDWYDKKRKYWNRWNLRKLPNLNRLRWLMFLNVSNNLLDDVDGLEYLKKLEILHLNNNLIDSVPALKNFKDLKELNLSNNKLSSISFLTGVFGLEYLDLHTNEIQDIRPIRQLIKDLDISDSKWDYLTINVADNPISIPPIELIKQGKDAVFSYLAQLETEQVFELPKFNNNDIKLILVGNTNVGKSTLSYWLREKEVNKKISSTHWMEIKNWFPVHAGKQFKIRIFDFGGQEYYHDTHHLFFTRNTLYITLWDSKSNRLDEIPINHNLQDGSSKLIDQQIYPLNYWLDSIKYHTSKKNASATQQNIAELLEEKSSDLFMYQGSNYLEIDLNKDYPTVSEENILVVQNKADQENPGLNFLNQENMKSLYSNIYDFAKISVIDEYRLSYLESLIFEIIDKMPLAGKEFLGTWAQIKRVIEENAESSITDLSIDQFKDYCNNIIKDWPILNGRTPQQIEKLLFNENQTISFASYLNDIGLVLFYPENNLLSKKVFINQTKILDGIYKVLQGLEKQKGEFHKDKVVSALSQKDYNKKCENLVSLMLQFKIIFEHPSKPDSYIAPLYLPKGPVQTIKLFLSTFKKVEIRFEYIGFIHKNVILDFFQLYGKKVLKEPLADDLYYYWREGIIIKDEDSNEVILIQFNIGNDLVKNACVDIFCLNKNKSNTFLESVILNLDKINEGWDVAKSVTNDGVDFIPLKIIWENELNKNWVFSYENKQYKLTDFKKHLKGTLSMKKIFISYSKTDSSHLQKLENHLSLLKRNGAIGTWNCRKLLPGEKWDGKIKKELEDADIILFLVSDDFLATDYIWDIEIKKAIERDNDPNDHVTVVPIVIRACDWEDSPLGVYNTAPKKAEVISSAENIDDAWTRVVKELKQIIVN